MIYIMKALFKGVTIMEFIFEVPVANSVLPVAIYHNNIALSDLGADVVGNDIPPPKPR